MDKNLLLKTFIFRGMSDDELLEALSCLGAHENLYKKGETLILPGDSITEFGIVMSGAVQVSCDDINGNRMIMATVSPGELFGESLAVTGSDDSPICATAAEEACVMWLHAKPIREIRTDNPLYTKIVSNFINAIANKCLGMNDRIQILSKKTIREKVITYLSQLAEHKRRTVFTLPLDRQDMANYLGVERSALSRELSRMAAEGIISYHKNSFRILE